MRGPRSKQGRLLPLLLFLVVLAVIGVLAAGLALGLKDSSPGGDGGVGTATALSKSYKMTAADLGGFGGTAPKLSSPSAIVVTMDTGKVLYERKADTRRPMASTTKIMTALLVLESGVDMESTVKVSAKAASTWEVSKWVKAGDRLNIKQLLYALMVRSMNGAAVALAENDAGTVAAFVDKMNARAQELGMKDTHFVTTNGLDAEGHYSTAADLAVLTRQAMKNEEFRDLVHTKQYNLEIAGAQPLVLKNTNKLLQEYNWVTGVKTGSTPNAHHCLVSSASRQGREVVVVVLGNSESTGCFQDSAALLQYGLDQFRQVELIAKGTALAEATVPFQGDGRLELVTDGSLQTDISADEAVTTQVRVEKALELPVRAGEVYGYVVAKVGDDEIGRVDLVAAKSFPAVTLGTKLAYYWHQLVH